MINESSFIAYAVRQRNDGGNAIRSATALYYKKKGGAGFNVGLEAMPLDGRIVLMLPTGAEVSDR